jgi:hypothetical protein
MLRLAENFSTLKIRTMNSDDSDIGLCLNCQYARRIEEKERFYFLCERSSLIPLSRNTQSCQFCAARVIKTWAFHLLLQQKKRRALAVESPSPVTNRKGAGAPVSN